MRPRRWHTEVQLTSKVVSCLGFVVGLMAQARASLAGWLAGWLDLGLVLAPSSKVPGWASRWPYGYRPTGAQRRTKCESSEPERRLARLLERLGTSERTEKGCNSRLYVFALSVSLTHPRSLMLSWSPNSRLPDSANCHRAVLPDSSCFVYWQRQKKVKLHKATIGVGSGLGYRLTPDTKGSSILGTVSRHSRTYSLAPKMLLMCRPFGRTERSLPRVCGAAVPWALPVLPRACVHSRQTVWQFAYTPFEKAFASEGLLDLRPQGPPWLLHGDGYRHLRLPPW